MYLTLLIDLYVPVRTGLRSANPDLLYYREKIRMLQIKRMDGVLLIYVLLFHGINYL